jgi:hypothetical protein
LFEYCPAVAANTFHLSKPNGYGRPQ